MTPPRRDDAWRQRAQSSTRSTRQARVASPWRRVTLARLLVDVRTRVELQHHLADAVQAQDAEMVAILLDAAKRGKW